MIQLTIARRYQSGHISLKFPWPYLRHIWPNTVVPARDLPAITAAQDLMDQFFFIISYQTHLAGSNQRHQQRAPGHIENRYARALKMNIHQR